MIYRKYFTNVAKVLATLLLNCFFVPAYAIADGPVRFDFETATFGAPPPDFASGLTGKGRPVMWVVVEDKTAPAGAKVLAETSADTTSGRFPLLILQELQAKDVDVCVHFRTISGTVDQAAGLVARLQDNNNYYIARANSLEDNVRLYRVVNGDRQQLYGLDIGVPHGEWQKLCLGIAGDRLTVSLNDKDLFDATDRTFTTAGRVGLWTKADSRTHFDELVVRHLP